MKYTKYGYRINPITEAPGYQWLFLPGGPGLGSEYLAELCKNLQLSGSTLLLDFPMDGTNKEGELGIKHWQEGLIDLLKSYDNPILVTHSFAGMFALSLPELEDHLAGLVLMNTTSANTFFQRVSEMQQKHDLPDLVPAASHYHLNPSNETYKAFWNTYKYYCFTAQEMPLGEKMISLLAFNNAPYYYAIQHFFMNYVYQWYPTEIPAMIITSENDYICPPEIFIQNKDFQAENIMNKIIDKAGHCPWLVYLTQVKACFDAFSGKYLKI